MTYMAQTKDKTPRTRGESGLRPKSAGMNGVGSTGSHVSGTGTLTNPGTHAPTLLGPNTKPSGKIATNGIVPNSPIGPVGTFDDMHDPAPGIDFKKFASVAGQAKSNLSGKATSKTISDSEGKFKGAATAGGRAKAENYGNGLASSYGKKGAHGKHKTMVG